MNSPKTKRNYRQVKHHLLFATSYLRKQLDDKTFDVDAGYKSYPPLGEAQTYFWTLDKTPRELELELSPTKSQLKEPEPKLKPKLNQNSTTWWSSWLTGWFN